MNELEVLALGADVIDGETAATDPAAMVAAGEAAILADQGANNGAQMAVMLAIAVPLLGTMYPSIAVIYTDEVQSRVAASLGPVLSKYGIDLADVAGSYGPEIAALMVCGPLAMATIAGVKADIQSRMKEQPKPVALRAAPVLAAGDHEADIWPEPKVVALG